jgi:hypothetical protein
VQKVDARRGFKLGRRFASLAVVLAALALPTSAVADSVTVRIEGRSGPLFPTASVTLPTTAVAPVGQATTGTCPGNSVAGAVDAATNHAWDGDWTDANGWSLTKINGASALAPNAQWLVFVDEVVSNASPCQPILNNNDRVLIYPACLPGATSTSSCFTAGPLELDAPALAGPGTPINMRVWQLDVSNSGGTWTSARGPAPGASVTGPDGSTTADVATITPGAATLTIAEKGPSTISAGKSGRAGDRAVVCISDGGDGYCGTTIAPPVPFDPYAFCQTTGSDGYCNSPDKVAPVGHIGTPLHEHKYGKGGAPLKFAGTVDFDPSETDHVNLRLERSIKATVTKVTKRRVWVTKKVHGKRVRKRVTKKKVRKVKQTVCYFWSDASSEFKRMKRCDVSTAPLFKAEGAEAWTYEFLSALPAGNYTFDAQAVDGAGNADSVPELGRNRVTFSIG